MPSAKCSPFLRDCFAAIDEEKRITEMYLPEKAFGEHCTTALGPDQAQRF
jgi:hypothetical protein